MKTSSSQKTFTEEIKGTVSEVIRQVRKLIKEGNARKVMIQDKNGKILFQSQLTIGVGGVALLTAIAPIVSAISMFALFMNDIKIIVERYPEEEEENGKDEYEVNAQFIEIKDEEEENEAEEGQERQRSQGEEGKAPDNRTDKTVGKKGEGNEEEGNPQ